MKNDEIKKKKLINPSEVAKTRKLNHPNGIIQ